VHTCNKTAAGATQCNETAGRLILLNPISAVSAEFRESQLIQLLSRFDIDSFRDAAPGLG
jgi:hypothetical protein